MFGSIVRGTILLIGGSFLTLAIKMAANPLINVQSDMAPVESTNPHWAQVIVEWFPAVVIAAIVAALIGSAVARRGRVR